MSTVNQTRDANRTARNNAKREAVAAFTAQYASIVADKANADLSEEELTVLATVESVAAYTVAYKAARATVGVVGQVSESVAA
jgi:hypothetical protein